VKRVLFLAYHFPPIGGAGVQRSARFARLLPRLGYEPVCVTGPGTVRSRWMPVDKTLLAEIPPETEVHRVPGPEPPPLHGWRIPAQRWLRLREPWTRWWIDGVKALGDELVGEADLIYAWMQPYDSAEAAAWLARSSGKPWVADLGDPWALDEMMVYPTAFHRRRELSRMGSLLGTASAIVMSTEEAVSRVLRAFPELRRIPVVAVPNGFEPADFEGPFQARSDTTFRIVHTGYLHTELGRQMRHRSAIRRLVGGDVRGVDIFTRSHVFLLEAIERLIADDPALAATIEVRLAGVLSAGDTEAAGRSAVVRALGFLDHTETVALMRSADLLFLPMHDLPAGVRATIVPGKTYEYLASGRPILAAVPEGDARDLLSSCRSALLCRPADAAAMADIVAGEIRRVRSNVPPPPPDPGVVGRYAYPRLAEKLAGIFDGVVSDMRRPRHRRADEVTTATE
jgi:glycosyltransferase involved in cell wall biosynthesis